MQWVIFWNFSLLKVDGHPTFLQRKFAMDAHGSRTLKINFLRDQSWDLFYIWSKKCQTNWVDNNSLGLRFLSSYALLDSTHHNDYFYSRIIHSHQVLRTKNNWYQLVGLLWLPSFNFIQSHPGLLWLPSFNFIQSHPLIYGSEPSPIWYRNFTILNLELKWPGDFYFSNAIPFRDCFYSRFIVDTFKMPEC